MKYKIKEKLEPCLKEGSPEAITKAIMEEFSVFDVEDVLLFFVKQYTSAPYLLESFWQRTSDACPLECTAAENEEYEFKKWVEQTRLIE